MMATRRTNRNGRSSRSSRGWGGVIIIRLFNFVGIAAWRKDATKVVVVEFLESGHLKGSEETLRPEQHQLCRFTAITTSFVCVCEFDLVMLCINLMLPLLLQNRDLAVREVRRHGAVGGGKRCGARDEESTGGWRRCRSAERHGEWQERASTWILHNEGGWNGWDGDPGHWVTTSERIQMVGAKGRKM